MEFSGAIGSSVAGIGNEVAGDAETLASAPARKMGANRFVGGIPLYVLRDAQRHGLEVAFETTTGYTYRGVLTSIDENMNVTLKDAMVMKEELAAPFRQTHSSVFVAGRQIVFFVLPSALAADYIIAAKKVRNRVKTMKQRERQRRKATLKDNSPGAEKSRVGGGRQRRKADLPAVGQQRAGPLRT